MPRFKRVNENEYAEFQLYQGVKAAEGFSQEILDAIINMLEATLQKHSQVLMVLMQFNFPSGLDADNIDNSCFQSFIESYRRQLATSGLDPEYLWVREVGEINQRVHYHLMLLLNGNRARYFGKPFQVRKYWHRAIARSFEYDGDVSPVHIQTLPQMKRGIMIRRGDFSTMELAVSLASYLAKISTKDMASRYIKAFSTSQFQQRGG